MDARHSIKQGNRLPVVRLCRASLTIHIIWRAGAMWNRHQHNPTSNRRETTGKEIARQHRKCHGTTDGNTHTEHASKIHAPAEDHPQPGFSFACSHHLDAHKENTTPTRLACTYVRSLHTALHNTCCYTCPQSSMVTGSRGRSLPPVDTFSMMSSTYHQSSQ